MGQGSRPGRQPLTLSSLLCLPPGKRGPGVKLLRLATDVQPPARVVSLQGMAQAGGVPCPGAAPGQPCVFKLVLLGSGSVGKSSLALRYVKNDFKSILPTVGCK